MMGGHKHGDEVQNQTSHHNGQAQLVHAVASVHEPGQCVPDFLKDSHR